ADQGTSPNVSTIGNYGPSILEAPKSDLNTYKRESNVFFTKFMALT
ncbi:hypothetical protein L915_01451, partial [Phytophthora nicotianae]